MMKLKTTMMMLLIALLSFADFADAPLRSPSKIMLLTAVVATTCS